mgnify:CR=1 FL=1
MNRTQTKWLFLIVLLVISAISGAYLSGYILLMWLKLPQVSLDLGTYFKYFTVIDAPKVAPFAKQIKLSGVIGFGIPLLVWLFALFLTFKAWDISVQFLESVRDLIIQAKPLL